MIKINMQCTENEPIEVCKENFPRLFNGDKQEKQFSCVYTEDGIDIQHTISNDDIFLIYVRNWVEREEKSLASQLDEIQRKLEILEQCKGYRSERHMTYAPNADLTFVFDDIYSGDEFIKTKTIGCFYGNYKEMTDSELKDAMENLSCGAEYTIQS